MSESGSVPVVEQLHALVAALRADKAELAARVVELEAGHAELAACNAELSARVEELLARLGKDSSNSSKPPGSDDPYTKKSKDRSLRGKSGRKAGKQRGDPGSHLRRVDTPDEVVPLDPPVCKDCGTSLDAAEVTGVRKHQVFDVTPPPPPHVTEYRITTRRCPCCGVRTAAPAPAGVIAPTQYGPGVLARAAVVLCAHYLPVHRAAKLIHTLLGVAVSTGFLAGIRGRAARLLEVTFLPHVRSLLAQAGVLHVDETTGRAAGKLEYVHVACTDKLTAMHTGGRSADDIDAGGVLPGYRGVIMRDGYIGYRHLTDAYHAWCGAHLLRDLRAVYDNDLDGQLWARAMADTLIDANTTAVNARNEGRDTLTEAEQATINDHYRGAAAKGITDNTTRAGPRAKEALTLARRFRDHRDMILRFTTDLTVPWTNNQAERDVRPVKVQQRTSGGCWRTLQGLADFAVVHSYLSTATKCGQDTAEVLQQLFTTGAWLPPAPQPAE